MTGAAQNKQAAASDGEVVRRVLAGSKDDFRILVQRHEQQIYGLLMRQIGIPEDARELSQDVFLKAYKGLRGFRGDASFSTWLTRIALNTANGYFTSRRFKEERQSEPLRPEHCQSLTETGEERLYPPEMVRRLRSLIGSLDQKYREVVVLCKLEEKTYDEAAAFLGVPLGTVSSRLNTAQMLLRQKLRGAR